MVILIGTRIGIRFGIGIRIGIGIPQFGPTAASQMVTWMFLHLPYPCYILASLYTFSQSVS